MYFVTVCTHQYKCLFGKIIDGKMILNKLGEIIQNEWIKTDNLRLNISLDEFIVMPNHFHGIIWIEYVNRRGTARRAPTVQSQNMAT